MGYWTTSIIDIPRVRWIAFDIGGIYHIDRFNIGYRSCNIGDTKFGEFGKDNSSSKYRYIY